MSKESVSDSCAEKAYEAIRSMIKNRVLRQGQSLAVPELAERFGMSVTPVREAIRRLESEGLLEVAPRKGTFVRSFSAEDLITGFEMAEALEGMAAFLAAERVAKGCDLVEALDRMEALVVTMAEHLERADAHAWAVRDTEFHESLCLLSNNAHIWQNYQKVRAQMDCVLWFVTPLYVDRANSTREHRGILDAVRRGDSELARILSQRHRNNVRSIIRAVASADERLPMTESGRE